MARIAGIDLPREKRVEIALTYIYGIGRSRSQDTLGKAQVNPDTRVKDLTEDEVARLRSVIEADFKVEAVETARRDHASDLAAEAVDRDFDAVIAFGGDGTINEAMQPLVGTDLSFGLIPRGSTNGAARAHAAATRGST